MISAFSTLAARTITPCLLSPLPTCVPRSALCSPRRLYSRAEGSITRLPPFLWPHQCIRSLVYLLAFGGLSSSLSPTPSISIPFSAPRILRTRYRARSTGQDINESLLHIGVCRWDSCKLQIHFWMCKHTPLPRLSLTIFHAVLVVVDSSRRSNEASTVLALRWSLRKELMLQGNWSR